MLRADTVESYVRAIKWEVFFAGILSIGLTWFVKVYFSTARKWLAVAITVSWAFLLVINYFSPFSLVYSEITALHPDFLPWGERFVHATGTANPWNLPANLLPLIMMVYIIDGAVRLWKTEDRRRAVTIGGAIVFFLLAAGIQAALVDYGILKTPYLVSFSYLAIVLAMSYEPGRNVVRSSRLSGEVAENERRWRSLLEEVKLLVVGLDSAGKVKYVNPYFLALTTFDRAEIVGKNWFSQFLPETERAQVGAVFKKALEMGEVLPHYKNTILDKSGKPLTIRWSNVVLRDPMGEITGSLSIGEDVTDREQAVHELAGERERMDVILSSLNTGLVLIDPDMTVIWANAMLQKMFPNCIGKRCYAVAENRTTP